MYSRNFVDKNVHIKADNILIEIEDQGILEAFVDAEMTSPSPRKVVDGKPIYATRQYGIKRGCLLYLHGLFDKSYGLRTWPPLGEYPSEYQVDRIDAHSLISA
jgi:hypothetical protein